MADGTEAEAFSSKATYVNRRLALLPNSELIRVALEVAEDHGDNALRDLIEDLKKGALGPDLLHASLTPALIREDWQKARGRLADDWRGAVTMAASTLDSALKHALEHTHTDFKKFDNMPALFDKAIVALDDQNWTPGFRTMLSTFKDVVETLGRVRGGYGDVHGTGTERPVVDASQAELVVNVAGSLALFLVQQALKKRP